MVDDSANLGKDSGKPQDVKKGWGGGNKENYSAYLYGNPVHAPDPFSIISTATSTTNADAATIAAITMAAIATQCCCNIE